jgi:uncharacterized membrane protein YjgN (DUF898 family)
MKKLLRSLLVLLVVSVLSLGLVQPVRAVPNDVDLLKQSVTAWEKGWS